MVVDRRFLLSITENELNALIASIERTLDEDRNIEQQGGQNIMLERLLDNLIALRYC